MYHLLFWWQKSRKAEIIVYQNVRASFLLVDMLKSRKVHYFLQKRSNYFSAILVAEKRMSTLNPHSLVALFGEDL